MNSTLPYSLVWPQPLPLEQALGLLRALASDVGRCPVVFEARAHGGRIAYAVRGVGQAALRRLTEHVAGLRTVPLPQANSTAPARAARLRLHHPSRPLDAGDPVVSVRTVLAALASLAPSEEVLVQVVVGPGRSPFSVPKEVASPWQGWLSRATVGVQAVDGRLRSRLQARADDHLLRVDVRFATTASGHDAENVIRGLLAASRIIERDGPRFVLSGVPLGDITAARPPHRFPLTLTGRELLVLLGLPIGTERLPGQPPAHPKLVVPTIQLSTERAFALTQGVEPPQPFGIPSSEARFHAHILGPTGSGKSTCLVNMAVADLAAGQSVAVVDPKADTIAALLERVPPSRAKDVVVLDPASPNPVPFNPLESTGRDPHVVADAVVDILADIFAPLGPRTYDVINAGVLTLTLTGGTLVDLPELLLDAPSRRARMGQLTDPALLGFWARFEHYSPTQVLDVIGPTMSRLRRVLLRPGLRAMLGQARGFGMDELFTRPAVLLVPTNRGIAGPQAASLLGSLVVAALWHRALAQAAVPEPRRRPLTVYVDETQEFLRLPGSDLSDALAQSRALNIRWVLANQFLSQLRPEMRAAIEVNARNKVVFALTASDARAMASESHELEATDFSALDTFEIYARLTRAGTPQPWISGRTLPLPPVTSDPLEIIAHSRARWPATVAQDPAGAAALADTARATAASPSARSEAADEPKVGRTPRRRS